MTIRSGHPAGPPRETPAPTGPTVELELAYEHDDDAVAEAIAILLGDVALETEPGEAA